jgi:2-polyprenyl-6-methoxyphenol hydroxylase-like FAD-dependent oxidoreductase
MEMKSMRSLGERAIVIGGSMAGLMTARVLSDFFDQVTVLERDQIADHPANHKSVPQGNHLHALLIGGQQVLSALYPDFTNKLHHLGAVRLRAGKDGAVVFPNGKVYSVGGAVKEPRDLGLDIYCQSRGLLEHCVRQCTLASANVKFRADCVVEGLIWEKERVRGLRFSHDGTSNSLAADLIVDAGGRGSRAPRWLTEQGYPAPAETTIEVDIAYASTKFRVPGYHGEPERLLGFFPIPPDSTTGGFFEEIENDTWHLSLFGRFGDYPPVDEAGFLAFAKSLPTPRLYEIIKDAERVTDIVQHRFPTSVHRHYERLATFPDGLLVLGDAICSFNPVYGQGMSSAALQVKALQDVLTGRAEAAHGLDGLAPAFFPKAAEVIATPWALAAASDFAYPKTVGERPPNAEEGARYFAALDALAAEDLDVHRLVTEVFQLARPLSALSGEPLRSRVLEKTPHKIDIPIDTINSTGN